MKIVKILLIILALIVVVLLAIGFATPKHFDVKREIIIVSNPENIFKVVSHFEEFPKWSPWQELDPNMSTQLEGTDGTVGAKYTWSGNDKVGKGAMTITKIEPGKSLEQHLEFIEPFQSESETYFKLEQVDGGTKVVWGMFGESGFMERIFMGLMGGMDAAVGKDYEKGLSNLKTLCETPDTQQENI